MAQSVGYGEMRRGRPGRRAKFVQVESRMSQTGANCDEWIACRPGTEGVLALGIAHVILSEKLAPQGAGSRAGSLIAGWSAGLPEYTPEAVEKQTGVSAAVIKRLAHEITKSGSALPSSAVRRWRTPTACSTRWRSMPWNRWSTGATGSLGFTPELAQSAPLMQAGLASLNALAHPLSGQPHAPQMLLLYEANPIFSAPPA